MARMTDPTDALVSFQQALLDGEIILQVGALDKEFFVHTDEPAPGVSRITYVRLDGRTVKAFLTAVIVEPIDGLPCFQLGVAVPEPHRNKGNAKSVLASGIAELKHGLAQTVFRHFMLRVSLALITSLPNELRRQ
jgi:hypothetical protein